MINEFYGKIGTQIRDHRNNLGMSQEALANHVGLARTTITNIEIGRQKLMVHQMVAIALALRICPSEFIQNAANITGLLPSEKIGQETEELLQLLLEPVET